MSFFFLLLFGSCVVVLSSLDFMMATTMLACTDGGCGRLVVIVGFPYLFVFLQDPANLVEALA